MELILYISFTCISILGKLWALAVVKRSWQQSILHVLTAVFIGLFLTQSTFELMLYIFSKESIAGEVALTGYYICAFTTISILPFIIIKLTRYRIHKSIFQFVIILNACVISMLIGSDMILSGIDHTGIALTRIPGEYYWVF